GGAGTTFASSRVCALRGAVGRARSRVRAAHATQRRVSVAIDKRAVLRALHARLAERLAGLTSSQKTAQAGATHAEANQEHAKDTRAIEQQYLARGLAERVETLREAVAAL